MGKLQNLIDRIMRSHKSAAQMKMAMKVIRYGNPAGSKMASRMNHLSKRGCDGTTR